METAYVYILRCGDGSLYTGWTNDLERRVKAHNQGKGGKYTRARLPVVLVYYEAMPGRGEALRRELAIKALTRKKKLTLISNFKDSEQAPHTGPKRGIGRTLAGEKG